MIAADVRGHFSHGMNRLEMYINDLLINSTAGAAVPVILKETPATAWVDGLNGLGAVVGEFCMDLAIQKAKTCGVGWVCAKRKLLSVFKEKFYVRSFRIRLKSLRHRWILHNPR